MRFQLALRYALLAFGFLCIVASAAQASPNVCAGGTSDSLVIDGKVENRLKLSLSDLMSYPPSSTEVSYYSGQEGLVTRSFIGVPLIKLLQSAIVKTDPGIKNDIIRKYVVITATDCYQTVLSVADLLSEYGGLPVLVAYADGDGNLLSDDGIAKLVVPSDKRGGRYVANIVRIKVLSVH